MQNFDDFFHHLTAGRYSKPHDWQIELAQEKDCRNRLIRIPTGFGKTLGVLAAWLWNRVHLQDDEWPRRLVWCLPMRVLVEQTETEVRQALEALSVFWSEGDHTDKVGIHQLMGGADSGDWSRYPEECAVLIGTQDMLLSRAMNRGYGAARARWPMEFGLLSQDCLWVMDEVQLMDVGLATSAQLQAFRHEDSTAGKCIRSCRTWWMSATLQPEWLKKSPDTITMMDSLRRSGIPADQRKGELWDTDKVSKPCRFETIPEKELAARVAVEHVKAGSGANGPTLVVVNTVRRAVTLYEALRRDKNLVGVDLRLVHSRFRPHERASWRQAFLCREACDAGTNRIIIATQVVEAGVDVSAGLLITELAPWSSMVQRFGRCARWGGRAQVIVFCPKDDKTASPYDKNEMDAAQEALTLLHDVSPLHLEAFEDQHPVLLERLYPYNPRHLLLRHEIDELFDTTPDLSGADIDISRFIRSGDERDLQVFWIDDTPEKSSPPPELSPSRDALCAVPFLAARDWLCGEETKSNRRPKLRDKTRAWVWDWLDGTWRTAERKDLYPGQTVLVAAENGGYDCDKGWTGNPGDRNFPIVATIQDDADSSQDSEAYSHASVWKTIATHGREVGLLAGKIAGRTVGEFAALFDLAGRVHDAGKSHVLFQGLIKEDERPDQVLLAKAPEKAWLKKRSNSFRHELASALALIAVLQRNCQDHEALLGPWRELLNAAGMGPEGWEKSATEPTNIEKEIISLSGTQFNLLAYLICAHHGKVRVALHSCPADHKRHDGIVRIRGIHEGATLPSVPLYCASGEVSYLPGSTLTIEPASIGLSWKTGQGWTERVLNLLECHGPFTLAWLEALFRAADQRASRNNTLDDLLNKEVMP